VGVGQLLGRSQHLPDLLLAERTRGTCFRLPSWATATTLVVTSPPDGLGDGGPEGLVLVADRPVADLVAGQPGVPPVDVHRRQPGQADLGDGSAFTWITRLLWLASVDGDQLGACCSIHRSSNSETVTFPAALPGAGSARRHPLRLPLPAAHRPAHLGGATLGVATGEGTHFPDPLDRSRMVAQRPG